MCININLVVLSEASPGGVDDLNQGIPCMSGYYVRILCQDTMSGYYVYGVQLVHVQFIVPWRSSLNWLVCSAL